MVFNKEQLKKRLNLTWSVPLKKKTKIKQTKQNKLSLVVNNVLTQALFHFFKPQNPYPAEVVYNYAHSRIFLASV